VPITIPQYHELMWPVLTALKELGGSATVQEMYEQVVKDEGFSEDQQQVLTKDKRMSEIQYRLHWARTHLRAIGAIENSARGVWTITEHGKTLSPEVMHEQVKAWRAADRARRQARKVAEDTGADSGEEAPDWRDTLLAHLQGISAEGFERLAQRILREAGFTNVTVTGRPGDGGIDGVGTYRPSLVSWPVYFQCKRYKGTVPARDVRDFRGAMAGRGDKGLFITTGSFTRDAQNEANRDGAPPIDLVDGEQLCDLLKDYSLGVKVEQRTEYDVTVISSFFDDYK
jgi:restriction system protein